MFVHCGLHDLECALACVGGAPRPAAPGCPLNPIAPAPLLRAWPRRLQRAYRDEAQRWHLVAACLQHCELCLASLQSGAPAERAVWVGFPLVRHAAAAACARTARGCIPRPAPRCRLQLRHWRAMPCREPPPTRRGWTYCWTCWVSPHVPALLPILPACSPPCLLAAIAGPRALCTTPAPPALPALPTPRAAGRNTLRAAMTTAIVQVDQLAYERHATPFGAPRLVPHSVACWLEQRLALSQRYHSRSDQVC